MSSSPRDVMPDETRQSMHSALAASTPSVGPTPRQGLDVYRREADALLVPDMARSEAVRRVTERMGLELVDGTGGAHVVFRIVQSTKYDYLTLHFDSDKFLSYNLRAIHGAAGV